MENMNIYYDDEGDYLEITTGDISNCYFNNIGNGIFRFFPKLKFRQNVTILRKKIESLRYLIIIHLGTVSGYLIGCGRKLLRRGDRVLNTL